MKTKSALIVLIALNCALLSVMLLQFPTAKAENVPDVLRARTIELVDDSGKVVRAQLLVEPTGEVVFRLRDDSRQACGQRGWIGITVVG